eukprot:m.202498 g.202498  ORF g.202498 m.202498 type:complete len:65 (-) comp18833_c0_seq2:1621-1815(-)
MRTFYTNYFVPAQDVSPCSADAGGREDFAFFLNSVSALSSRSTNTSTSSSSMPMAAAAVRYGVG